MVVPRDDGLVATLAIELNVGQRLRDDQFLLVGTFLDIDDFMIVHEGTAHLNGLAYIAELSRSVAGHHQRVRIIIGVGTVCGDAAP